MSTIGELKAKVSAELIEISDESVKIGVFVNDQLSDYIFLNKQDLLNSFED